ncbi:MAG: hypothetical protein EOP04_24505, partial [Proteobacteria bacterium]
MWSLVLLFPNIFFVMLLLPRGFAEECPDNFVLLNKQCYYFSTEARSWDKSKDTCSQMGSKLARIENIHTNNQLYELITGSNWIGFHNFYEKRWKWVDGTNQEFKNWAPNEPNNANHGGVGENCAELCKNNDHCPNGKWNDWLCSSQLKFICQREPLNSEERLDRSCRKLKETGFKASEVNIAFTGEGGVGKSSMINSMRGLKEDDERAAPTSTGVIGTTT